MSDFKTSKTKENLMKAFAGESQARNRYTFAASQAKAQKLHVVEAIFKFTADQEKEHAELFYMNLKDLSGENVTVDGTYPIDINDDVLKIIRAAQHNEYEEHTPVYSTFSNEAREEGFTQIATLFSNIAKIEKTHGDRFGRIADLMEKDMLFVSDVEVEWMCLNCGYIFKGVAAPNTCPVCNHERGYFIRLSLTPFNE